MGYHTWVAKKLQALTEQEKETKIKIELAKVKMSFAYKSFEEYKSRMVPIYSAYIEEYKNYVNNNPDDTKALSIYNKWVKNSTDDATLLNEYNKYIKDREKKLELFTNGGDKAFQYIVKHYQYPNKIKHKGEIYIGIYIDNPFRVVTGYTNKKITSKEKLKQYLSTCGEVIRYCTNDSVGFKNGYTPELEQKIDDFFQLHGEDNLLFHFE